jgi:hypothetical protein
MNSSFSYRKEEVSGQAARLDLTSVMRCTTTKTMNLKERFHALMYTLFLEDYRTLLHIQGKTA